MAFLLNIFVGLLLIVFQTTVVPRLPLVDNCYDLLLPFITYQGIFRPPRENLPMVIGVGVVMDQLSGAPIGVFVVTYLWILIGIRWGLRFLHMGNYYLVPLVVAVAVLIENAFFAAAFILSSHDAIYSSHAGGMVLSQVGWALISAPLFMMLLNAVHHGWATWISNLNAEKGDAGF